MGLCLSDIAGAYSAIGSGVAGQNAHWNRQCAARINSVAHIAEGDVEFLSIGHSDQINSDLGAADAKTAHAPSRSGLIWIWSRARTCNRNRNWKGHDHLMGIRVSAAAFAAFDPGRTRKREVYVKIARRSMGLA